MRDYCELLKDLSASLVSFDKKWKNKLTEHSALSSYHTTKRAQRETIGTAAKLASVIDERCAALEEVIKELRKEVNRYYPSRGVGKTPKHNRADRLKDEFKSARSPVKNLEEKLKQLENKETTAKDAVRQTGIAYENIQYGPPTSESKSDRAKKKYDEKQRELDSIQKQIDQTQSELQKAKLVYREQANIIFEKCQFIERKRLELIRSTLIKFIETIHSDDSLDKVDEIYSDTISKITKEQNTAADLQFWAKTYGIDLSSALPIVNETSATAITQSPEAAEVQTTSEATISKPKVKPTKNSDELTTPTSTT